MNKLFMNSSISISRKEKKIFMFVHLTNMLTSTLSLDSTIKRTKLKHNNMFGNKLCITLGFGICNIIYLYVYKQRHYTYMDLRLKCESISCNKLIIDIIHSK